MPALLLLLSLLLFTFTFYFLLFLFTFYFLFHILSSILHPTTPIGVVNNDQRIWMPALLLQMLFHPTFSITTSPHFASGKQGQSIYFIPLCSKSQIFVNLHISFEDLIFSFACLLQQAGLIYSDLDHFQIFGQNQFPLMK